MILSVFITVISDHDKPQPPGCLLDEVERLAAMIPPGQPILVGHHSERRARRDAQRIENGMKRAVMLFERAEYWEERARRSL